MDKWTEVHLSRFSWKAGFAVRIIEHIHMHKRCNGLCCAAKRNRFIWLNEAEVAFGKYIIFTVNLESALPFLNIDQQIIQQFSFWDEPGASFVVSSFTNIRGNGL